MESRSRRYVNIVKGIAVLLMLWGHCIQYCASGSFNCFDDGVYQAIYSFHMPLFMLVSGYLFYFSFSKRDWKALVIRRIQSMAQPIVFGTILCNLLVQLLNILITGEAHLLNGALFTGMNLYWFLWCVLSSSLAVGTAFKITENPWLRAGALVLGAGFVALFPEMDMHLFMYPFFLTGFLWAKHKQVLMKTLGRLRHASFVLFPLLLSRYSSKHFIYLTPIYSPERGLLESMQINLLRYAAGIAGSVFVLTLTELLLNWLEKNGQKRLLLTAFSRLGEHSLQIYCLSAPLLSYFLPIAYGKVVQLLGGNLFAQNMLLFHLLLMPALSAAYALGLYLLVVLLKKTKIHGLIFGR